MRESAALARTHACVRLHTHLAENDNDIAYTREKFGCTPAEYAEQFGWVGPDVWHAHCVKLDPAGIALFVGLGVAVPLNHAHALHDTWGVVLAAAWAWFTRRGKNP